MTTNYYPMATVETTPSNPTGTTSTTLVQAGVGTTFTPEATGKVLVIISGAMYNATTGDGVQTIISYAAGTSVPSNGAAATGTTAGNTSSATSSSASYRNTLICVALLTLTPGTEYWVDLQFAAITGGTADLTGLQVFLHEVPN